MPVRTRFVPAALLATLLVTPAALRADEFSDFRIPDHRVYSASADARGSLSRQRGTNSAAVLTQKYDAADGALRANGYWWRDSERGSSYLSGNASVYGFRLHRRELRDTAFPIPVDTHVYNSTDDLFRDLREQIFVATQWRRYPWTPPLGLEFTCSAASSFAQSWHHFVSDDRYSDPSVSSSTLNNNNNDRHAKSLDLTASVAVGYGRVRDATGVYQARMLERRLRDRGVLKQPLTSAGAGKLATLFYLRGAFGSVHERPDKYFWREVERILREDGALGEQGLDAYSLLRILEPLFPQSGFLFPSASSFIRRTGYFAGLVVTDQQRHQVQRQSDHYRSVQVVDMNPPAISDFTSSYSQKLDDNIVLVGPEAEVHRPFGMRWQADAVASAGYAILRNARVDEAFVLYSGLSATYEIADRWLWTGQAALSRDYLRRPPDRLEESNGNWATLIGSSVSYYLEDHVVLELGLLEQQNKFRTSGLGLFSGRIYQRQDRVQLGVTYRFLGGLDAPGVIAPVRLAPRGI